MRKCHQNTLEYFKRIENNIKKTSPLNYEGQNMDLWGQDIRTNVNLLVNSGQYDHKLSEYIVNLALTAGGDNNEDWKSIIRPLKREFKEMLLKLSLFTDKKDMDKAMAQANLTPKDILTKIETEYISLINTEEWPPALNKIDPTAPPSHKQQSALTTVDLRPNGSPSGGNKNRSHRKANTYAKRPFKRNNNKQPSSSKHAWKYEAPKA